MSSSKAKTNEVNEVPAVKADEFIIDSGSFDPFGFLDGVDDLPADDIWGEQYPKAQWNNSEKNAKKGKGMWEFPAKYFSGTAIERNYEFAEVDHNENAELGALVDMIHLTVIARASRWEHKTPDGQMIYAAQPDDGGKGWSKRYYFLGFIREMESEDPVVVTFKGHTGKYFEAAFEAARRRLVRLVRQTSGRTVPGYLFWLPLEAGDKIMVGSTVKSPIYPPVLAMDDIADFDNEGIANLLNSLYIGDKLVKSIKDYLFAEATQWANEAAMLPAPGNAPQLSAGGGITVLPGGVLHFEDMSNRSPGDWIKAAAAIPGLFDHEKHASNTYVKTMKAKGKTNDSRVNQWETWRDELQKRYSDMLKQQETVEVERMLQAGG